MNQVNLCGYLGKDFELRYTPNGIIFVRSSLAISENYKNQNGESESQTNWIPIVIFGKRAEVANQYLKKGDKFLGTGKIVTSSYTDQNGTTRYGWQVVIKSFEFVNLKNDSKEQAPKLPEPNLDTPSNEAMSNIDENQIEKYIEIENNNELPF